MTLADGTRTQVYNGWPEGPGGQKVGTAPCLVRLYGPGYKCLSWSLVLVSGFRSTHKTKQALKTCATWHEVPLAIEAVGVVS